MGTQSAHNGTYLIEMQDGEGADPGDHGLYQKGVGGWKTISNSIGITRQIYGMKM